MQCGAEPGPRGQDKYSTKNLGHAVRSEKAARKFPIDDLICACETSLGKLQTRCFRFISLMKIVNRMLSL